MDEVFSGASAELLVATVANYNSATGCTLTFDGSDTPSTKRYKYLANASLAAGARVLVAKIAGSYLVIGRIRP